jgi:hypothetical protein
MVIKIGLPSLNSAIASLGMTILPSLPILEAKFADNLITT